MNEERPDQSGQPSELPPDEQQPIHERSDKVSDFNDPIDDASDDSFPASDPPSWNSR